MRYSGTEFYFKHFNFFFFLKEWRQLEFFIFVCELFWGLPVYWKEFFLDVYIYK